MAKMIPSMPHEFSSESGEGLMYNALSKLPDDFIVFHSFKVVSVKKNQVTESETDFVIFHPRYGLLCIEAKNGKHITFKDGEWYYGNGIQMRHGGPYNQAQRNKYRLIDRFHDCGLEYLAKRCKVIHAVWFPLITQNDLRQNVLPPDGCAKITITQEALSQPLPSIKRLFDLEVSAGVETNLNEENADAILRNVLCPEFSLVPSLSSSIELEKLSMNRLLDEQIHILDFLVEQRSAVICGAAGTGKTMLALEKARRHAQSGDRILFLCFNRMLCDYLREHHVIAGVEYWTIDAYACSMTSSPEADFEQIVESLESQFLHNSFPFDHVIVDEGQDFGQARIESSGVLKFLQEIVLSSNNGSFYVFYDKNQLIQSTRVPSCIENAECKLALHKNCRNTLNIAKTSIRPLKHTNDPTVAESTISGALPLSCICESEEQQIEFLETILNDVKKITSDVVILTCKTETESCLAKHVSQGVYHSRGHDYRFTTCRKFKGLEADAVILMDVSLTSFRPEESLLFYAGASRARSLLYIVMNLSKEECTMLSRSIAGIDSGKPQKDLATVLNTMLKR